MIKTLVLSSLALNIGLLLGRLSGFAREAFIAATYGATTQADIVVLMLTVPDFLVAILMGGAMGVMLIPEFSQRPNSAHQLLYQSILFFGAFFALLSAVLYWQMHVFVTLLAPGFGEEKISAAIAVLDWVIWLIPLTVMSGVVTAFLHAENKFFIAAIGTLIINCFIIVGLVSAFISDGSLFLVAGFVLLGGCVRLLSQLLQVRLHWAPILSLMPWRLSNVLILRYGQAMMSGSMLLLFPVVARAMASYEGDGSVALFNYATRLIEFPLVIAITFLAAIFFPRMAKTFSCDLKQHKQLIHYGLQITLGISIVAAITLISLNDDYTDIVYGYGDMQDSDVARVAALISIGLVALPLQGVSIFLTAVFNARKNMLTPLYINGAGLLIFLFFNALNVFGQGLQALMWGMVVSYGFICILQFMFLKIEGLSWGDVLLNKAYISGFIFSVALTVSANNWINNSEFSAVFSLTLACLMALLSLFVMALFNKEFRLMLGERFGAK